MRCWRPRDFWGCLLSLTLDAVLKTPPLDLRRERCCHRVLAGRINNQRINNYTRSFRKNLNTSIHSDDNSLNTAWFFFSSRETWLTCFSKLLMYFHENLFSDQETRWRNYFSFLNFCLITERWVLYFLRNDWREMLGSLSCCVSVFLPPSVTDGGFLPSSFLPSFHRLDSSTVSGCVYLTTDY